MEYQLDKEDTIIDCIHVAIAEFRSLNPYIPPMTIQMHPDDADDLEEEAYLKTSYLGAVVEDPSLPYAFKFEGLDVVTSENVKKGTINIL